MDLSSCCWVYIGPVDYIGVVDYITTYVDYKGLVDYITTYIDYICRYIEYIITNEDLSSCCWVYIGPVDPLEWSLILSGSADDPFAPFRFIPDFPDAQLIKKNVVMSNSGTL